ncbi:hypothetical protein M569_09761, partial [Genlisea aurea]
EPEVVIASSPTDAGVSCWDINTGNEFLRCKNCASTSHGLVSVGGRFLASSQIRENKSSSYGSIFYWSWNKPQVEVKSFPAESIIPIVSNSEGTYIVGGGASGDIYLWEVSSGRLLKKWHAHYRGVTCLEFNDDQSLLISGAEDGCVRVWSLFRIFDDAKDKSMDLYEHSFHHHSLKVTDVKSGHGFSNAVIVSSSEDRTCKVWSLGSGKLLRNIVFPSIIDAVVLQPCEAGFYAGSRDGKIYIGVLYALSSSSTSSSDYGAYIAGAFSDHGKAITSLALSADGNLLVSGSEDGMVRIWDFQKRTTIRVLRHSKGPVNNVKVIRQKRTVNLDKSMDPAPRKLQGGGGSSSPSLLPPPLEKFVTPPDENRYVKTRLSGSSDDRWKPVYVSVQRMEERIKELQVYVCSSSDAEEAKLEKVKRDRERWKKLYEDLHRYCVDELVD